jgi:hypothetical protein
MKRLCTLLFLVCCASLAWAQRQEAVTAAADPSAGASLFNMQRQVLYGDIAYYQWTVQVGPGRYDRIRLHRVVREQRPYHPASTAQAVMFLPGLPTYFVGLYIPPAISQSCARDHSIAIFLAKNGIDVWGMDYRWALVPGQTTDFRFMKRWGVSRDVEDAQIALTIAREMRGDGIRPAGPLFVSGLSYGAGVSYGVAANDSQRPPRLRNVKGIIPLDCGVRYSEPDVQAEACDSVDPLRSAIQGGNYYNDVRGMEQIGRLAIDAPNDTSPFAPPLTNYQFDLVMATSPNDIIPWHFAGGFFDSTGMPTDLRFTDVRMWMDLLANNEPPYYPIQLDLEYAEGGCPKPHLEAVYTDHIGDVRVPIFLVGAGGGFGHYSDYTTTLTASTDITIRVVQLLSDDQRAEDYGHVDLLEATNAETLVWQPILAWIQAHP